MNLCDIEIKVIRAEIYPNESLFDKEKAERRIEYILKNYESCVISHVWSEANLGKTTIYRICFRLLDISSCFEVLVDNYANLIKFLGLLNVSHETSDENVEKIKEALRKI